MPTGEDYLPTLVNDDLRLEDLDKDLNLVHQNTSVGRARFESGLDSIMDRAEKQPNIKAQFVEAKDEMQAIVDEAAFDQRVLAIMAAQERL